MSSEFKEFLTVIINEKETVWREKDQFNDFKSRNPDIYMKQIDMNLKAQAFKMRWDSTL